MMNKINYHPVPFEEISLQPENEDNKSCRICLADFQKNELIVGHDAGKWCHDERREHFLHLNCLKNVYDSPYNQKSPCCQRPYSVRKALPQDWKNLKNIGEGFFKDVAIGTTSGIVAGIIAMTTPSFPIGLITGVATAYLIRSGIPRRPDVAGTVFGAGAGFLAAALSVPQLTAATVALAALGGSAMQAFDMAFERFFLPSNMNN